MSNQGRAPNVDPLLFDLALLGQMEDKLRDSRDWLSGVIASAMDAIITINEQNQIVLFNTAAEKMFGHEAADVLGQSIELFIPQSFHGQPTSHGRHFHENRVASRTIGRVRALWVARANGEQFQIEGSTSQCECSGKSLFTVILREVTESKQAQEHLKQRVGTSERALKESAFQKLLVDEHAIAEISERKQAEQRLAEQAVELTRRADEVASSRQALQIQTALLRSVLDSMGEGLVAADEHGKFILWNPAAEKIVGLGAADVSSQEWTQHYGLFLPDTRTPFPSEQNPLTLAIQGKDCTAEMFIRNIHQTEGVWIEASAHPLKDAGGVRHGGVVAFRDITHQKKAGEEIHNLNQMLEQRVAERTAQLEDANRELESFTYSVAHDLRAPLRHISGFSEILMKEFNSSLAPQAQRYLQWIHEGSGKMRQLVDELLNLARVGRQVANLQRVNLNLIIEEVIGILQPEISHRKVEWRIANLPFVECDLILLKQVFQNLISNALKYSRPRSLAVIEIGMTSINETSAIFVRDNGVGFDMKYADRLFGVFQRLHRSEDFEGIGVGLATVQRIIKKHQGRVWAEAVLDKGATFYFTFSGLRSEKITTNQPQWERNA